MTCPHDTPGGEQFCIQCLRRICDARALLLGEMAGVLEAVEWQGLTDYGSAACCVSCGADRGGSSDPLPHEKDCALARVLGKWDAMEAGT